MPSRSKTPRRPPPVETQPPADLGPNPLCTPQARRQLLRALGERIDGHIRFICRIEGLTGVSAEAKDRAVATFHERLAGLEKSLGSIVEHLQLE